MKKPSPKNRQFSLVAIAVMSVALIGMTALPVHAGSSDQNAITIKMNVSDINTASDYQDAVDRFRSKAKNACKVNGVKALSVKMQEGACVDKLVKSFEEQLNLRFKTVTFDRTDEAVG